MGLQNFITLLVFVPILYVAGFVLVLFERRQGYLDTVTTILLSLFGVKAEKFPFLVLFCSILLWEISFLVSTFSASLKREKAWDNRTPRTLKEKKEGLPLRAQSAHYNEMEQFTLTFMCLMASLYLGNDIKFINFCLSGWILHRIPFHVCYWLNIDALRSFSYVCSFHCTLLLILSCVYDVDTIDTSIKQISSRIFDNLMNSL